jgi:hypothetical protein
MSNKHNPTNTTAAEHNNGEDLPSGGGNEGSKKSVLNSFLVDFIVDTHNAVDRDADASDHNQVVTDDGSNQIDIQKILSKYKTSPTDLHGVAASVLLSQDVKFIPTKAKHNGVLSPQECFKQGFYDGFQWSSAMNTTHTQKCIACGERWRDMIMHGYKSGVITSEIVSDLMVSSTGCNDSPFDVFLIKKTGAVATSYTGRTRNNALLVTKVKAVYNHITNILNNHSEFCKQALGFKMFREYVSHYTELLHCYSMNVSQLTLQSDPKEVHTHIQKLILFGQQFKIAIENNNSVPTDIKELMESKRFHQRDDRNPPAFLSFAIDILKKLSSTSSIVEHMKQKNMESLSNDIIACLKNKNTMHIRKSKRIQESVQVKKRSFEESDMNKDSHDSQNHKSNKKPVRHSEKKHSHMSNCNTTNKKTNTTNKTTNTTKKKTNKKTKGNPKKKNCNGQPSLCKINSNRTRRLNKTTTNLQAYRKDSTAYLSHQNALLQQKQNKDNERKEALAKAKAKINDGSYTVRSKFHPQHLVSDSEIEKLSLNTVWEKWVNSDGTIVKGPEEDRYGNHCVISIPRDEYETGDRDIWMAELGFCPAGKRYVYGLDYLHLNAHCVVPWEITKKLVDPVLVPSTTSPITKVVPMGPGGQFSSIGDRNEAGAVLYDSESNHKLHCDIFSDVEFNYREVAELILQYNIDKAKAEGKKEAHRDTIRGHIGFDGGFNTQNWHPAKTTQAADDTAVGARPDMIHLNANTIPLYVAAGDLLHRCSIFSRELMKKKGNPIPLSDPFRRSLFAEKLEEVTCAPGFVDFEAFTWALLKLGKTGKDGKAKWFRVQTNETYVNNDGLDENGDPIIMVGKRHTDGPNDGREPGTVVYSITFHHSDGYIYRLSLICYSRKCCGDYISTEHSFYEPMYNTVKKYFEDRNAGMHLFEMSLHPTMARPSHKVKAYNLNQKGEVVPRQYAGAEWQVARCEEEKSMLGEQAEPITFDTLPYFSLNKPWYKNIHQQQLAAELAKKYNDFADVTYAEINNLPFQEAQATAAYLSSTFYTGRTGQANESDDDSFNMSLFTVRELMNRNGYMSSYASTICHFCIKYDLPRYVKEELVLCAAACPSPVTFRSVFNAWESASKRLETYLLDQGISLATLLSRQETGRLEGDFIMAFLHTCQCFTCLPTTGPYARQQSSHKFPGMSDQKVIDQKNAPWLTQAGLYSCESKQNIKEQIEKFRHCVHALHEGKYYTLHTDDLPHAISGPVSSTNLKTLIVLTGLHLPNLDVNDQRTHYDIKEAWSIQEAKWAKINPDSNYATNFLADITPKGCKNWFDEGVVEPRFPTGNWSRGMKCTAERFLSDIKSKELDQGKHMEDRLRNDLLDRESDIDNVLYALYDDHLRDDLFDRENDIENTLCALYRNFPRSDVFFFGQDLFNITGCDVLVKMWDTDEWIPLRSYFDTLQSHYHTHISTIPYRGAKNAARRLK